MTPKELRAFLELMEAYRLVELEIERSGLRVRLRREPSAPASASHPAAVSPGPSLAVVPVEGERRPAEAVVTVEAPMVGTFYHAPAPDAPPYVREGDPVKEGQVLCVIEAMKLMNEIESRVSGRLVKILVENGQPVEYGQPLFLIEPV